MMCGFLEWRWREEGKASLSLKGLGFLLAGGVEVGRLALLGLAGDFDGGLPLRLEVSVREGRSRNPSEEITSMVALTTCLSCGR